MSLEDNKGFMFLKTISDASNPFNLIVEDKLSSKLLAAKRPINEMRHWVTKMSDLDQELHKINELRAQSGAQIKKGGDIQKGLSNLPGFAWSKYPGEKHLPGHNFTGPGTNLEKRLNPDDTPKADSIPINRVDAAAYRHDLAYRKFKDIENRHAADRRMIAEMDAIENPTFRERIERMLVKKMMQAKIFLGQGLATGLREREAKIYAEERHKEFRRPKYLLKVKVFKKDDIWSADLIVMKEEKGFKYCLTVIDLYTRFAWVIPLKSKAAVEVKKAFEEIFKKSKRKPKKLWCDKGTEFFNKHVKSLFEEVYSTENEGKAVVIERFNRTLKRKLFKKFTEQGNQKWLKILPGIVKEYNNSVHSSIGETPAKASLNPQIIAKQITENNYENENLLQKNKPKFKVGDRVRIFKWKNKFEKGYKGYWTSEIFEVEEVLNTSPITYKIKDLDDEEIKGRFYSHELQKTEL